MSSSLKITSAKFTLSIILLSFATCASAGPKEDVAAAASTWAAAPGEDQPDKVLQLYSDDAVLWGTFVSDGARRSIGVARLFRDCL